jgi:hypothetical protein
MWFSFASAILFKCDRAKFSNAIDNNICAQLGIPQPRPYHYSVPASSLFLSPYRNPTPPKGKLKPTRAQTELIARTTPHVTHSFSFLVFCVWGQTYHRESYIPTSPQRGPAVHPLTPSNGPLHASTSLRVPGSRAREWALLNGL